jgi:transposase
MPYKVEIIALRERCFKRSAKLLDCQIQKIVWLTAQGWSQRKLAKEFNVSRRLITYIQDPKKKERNLLMRKQRGGSQIYYDKEYNTAKMREYRRYKVDLLNNISDFKTKKLKNV